ncbi:MAG: hypothetical protein K2Y17_11585 [Qipengyuania sp.]|nr:hypothetical protein [Qipengyuania sp.]
MNHITRSLIVGSSALALASCGADQIASPGTSGNVTINLPPAPAPTPTPTPTSTLVTPAGACPTIADPQGLTDSGTISGPTGTYRVCTLPSRVSVSTTLPKISGLLYRLNGRVDVGCDGGFAAPTATTPYASTTVGCTAPLTADTNVTLTIAPGVIVYAGAGQSWLAVNRGNKIDASGSATQPIVFTSSDNVAGFNNDQSIGQWGGVVLLGRARVTDCRFGTVAAGTCERDTEGATERALYGGANDAYNAGTMRYVQIRYSGFVLSANNELQALTAEGVGSGTTIEYFQSHNSSDDAAEFFGGNLNVKYYVATGADDDSLDVDTGARLNVQHALMVQRAGQGDTLMEIDSNGLEGDTPRTNLKVVNFIGIQPQTSSNNEANGKAAVLYRGNADVTLYNGVIVAPNNECIRMTSNASAANRATLAARSVVLQCAATKYIGDGSGAAPFTAAEVATAFGSGSNNNTDAFTNTLTALFVNGANEDAVVATDPTALSSFFSATPTPYRIGVAWSGNTSWYTGWTCNSATASFGAASSACTSLPTT